MNDFLSLKTRDFLKGLVMAVGTAVATVIYQSIEAGSLKFDWKVIGLTAAGSALVYLMKNFLTDGKKEAVKTLKDAGEPVPYSAPKDSTI